MNAKTLIEKLESNDVKIWIEDDKVKWNAPKGVITDTVLVQMKQKKPELLVILPHKQRTAKQGIKGKNSKKPEKCDVKGDTNKIMDDPVVQVQGVIQEALDENNKKTKDIVSVVFPLRSVIQKCDVVIKWDTERGDPDPSGSPTTPQVNKPDDYDTDQVDKQPLAILPERCSDITPHLNKIILGDCLEELKDLPDNSVDIVVTDPPYGIGFMGKAWDTFDQKYIRHRQNVEAKSHRKRCSNHNLSIGMSPATIAGKYKYTPETKRLFQQFLTEVGVELLRVLKPGAFLMMSMSPRQDSLARAIIALEDAGFSIGFTSIYWTHAQGFPKAQNISKAIDKKFEFVAKRDETIPTPPDVKKLNGSYSGFQPKPAVEVIIVAMKPMDEKTYVNQALKNGKGVTWLGDCRIPYADNGDKEQYAFNMNGNQRSRRESGQKLGLHDGDWKVDKRQKDLPKGRFPANLLISDEVLDDGKEHKSPPSFVRNTNSSEKSILGFGMNKGQQTISYGDTGGFSRFFSLDAWAEKNLPFFIVPKASPKEKGEGNNHPTVKPIKLMSYLITMGSREGDVVLDPFCGSGSTCVASKMLKRKFIGIELDEKYREIAVKRIKAAKPLMAQSQKRNNQIITQMGNKEEKRCHQG